MKNNLMEYPHPLLSVYNKDFHESSFEMELIGQADDEKDIIVTFKLKLNCPGMLKLINSGNFKTIFKITCFRTSYRDIQSIVDFDNAIISIPKNKVADSVSLQAIIVASKDYQGYKLEEFNKSYFGEKVFDLKKGDMVAMIPEVVIKLDKVLEKNIPSIILVSTSPELTELKVVYAKTDESNIKYQNYITIWLPKDEYACYENLRTKRVFKAGVARFLQASVILPALVEAISKLRCEDLMEKEDPQEATYHNTIWANSVCEALKNIGVVDLSECQYSDYELANKILGNVQSDSLINLVHKMQDWSTLHQEEDTL